MNGAPQSVTFQIGSGGSSFTVNGKPFDEMDTPRYLVLNTVSKWTLQAVGAPHVFHIHVNPFLYRRVGPTGAQEWVWKDTLLLPADEKIYVYSRYLDFTGRFVIHCHILDHEDLGMMQEVDVVRKLPTKTSR